MEKELVKLNDSVEIMANTTNAQFQSCADQVCSTIERCAHSFDFRFFHSLQQDFLEQLNVLEEARICRAERLFMEYSERMCDYSTSLAALIQQLITEIRNIKPLEEASANPAHTTVE